MKVMILDETLEDVEKREPRMVPEPAGAVVYATFLAVLIFGAFLLWNQLQDASVRGAKALAGPGPAESEKVAWASATISAGARNAARQTWQFGPEWLCHHCHSFDIEWTTVEPRGRIFSWERVWSPSHDALRGHGAYLAVLVELPHAGNVRMVGNLLGDPMQAVTIGADVEGVFEHHLDSTPPYSLLQWQTTTG